MRMAPIRSRVRPVGPLLLRCSFNFMELQKIKVLTWNTRGLGDVEKCNVVKNVIKGSRCDICCLQETKWSSYDPSCHAKALPNFFDKYCASLLAIGSSGGSVISWKKNYSLLNSWTTAHTVSAVLRQEVSGGVFMVTSVYGPSADDMESKKGFLEELGRLSLLVQHPWILLGDFNLTRWLSDRPGVLRGLSLMTLFNDLIRYLEMEDVQLENRAYTWSSKRPQPNFSRIDRVFLTQGWSLRFPMISLRALEMVVSDHCPLVLSCCQRRPIKRELKWENYWFAYPEVRQMVVQTWEEGDSNIGLAGFYARTTALHKKLRSWDKERFGRLAQRIELGRKAVLLYDRLEELRPLSQEEFKRRQGLRNTIFELANIEEKRWLQRSRCLWLREGDNNTRYFHKFASSRATKNAITSLNHEGVTITNQTDILKAFQDHLKALLGSSSETATVNLAKLYPVGLDLNHLAAEFSEKEVHLAIKGLAPNRASGPDGLSNEFVKTYWEIIKPDLMKLFQQFYEGSLDLSEYNRAKVIFLAKNEGADTVRDYRPISIINIIPKIISKVLANRLSGSLPVLISTRQSAFLKGRFISENFIATRELLHHTAHTKRPAIFTKIDFSKAFDSLNWDFLYEVLKVRGFPVRWIGWIRILLTTASTKITINGESTDYFLHRRGLRQGDPMSPMLFNLAVDVLQQMVRQLNELLDNPISRKFRESLIALQYADDSVFIAKADTRSLLSFKLLLRTFSAVSGLSINYSKSSMVPFNLHADQIQEALAIIGCKRESLPVTYLGMPLSITQPKRADYLPLIEKLERRLQSWHGRLLSRGGRVQLTRSVLSALPIYYMTCFKLPSWVIRRIDHIRRSFLWGAKLSNGRVLSLINWDTVCLPREWGGLGLIDLALQNVSLLLRWWWRPNTAHSSIWADIVTRIRISTIQEVNRWNTGGTFFWKSLLRILPLFFWSVTKDNDIMRWNWETSGLYSAKSFYVTFKTGGKEKWPFPELWGLKAPQTVKIFCFLLLQGRILTRDVLHRRNIPCPLHCVMCSEGNQETSLHLLFYCQFAQRVWAVLETKVGFVLAHPRGDISSTWTNSWKVWSSRGTGALKLGASYFVCTCWQIWLHRNNRIFRNLIVPPEVVATRVVEVGRLWFSNC